jgi:hypothetical protein
MAVALTALFISLAGVAWAATLAKNSVTSKTIKNGEVKPKDLNDSALEGIDAATLDGLEADGLVRAASSSTSDSTLDGNGNVLPSPASITAPGPGFLLIVGSYDAQLDSNDGDTFQCQLAVDGVLVTNSERIVQIDNGGNQEEDCAVNALTPVSAGPHSVDIQQALSDSDLDIRRAEVDVLYVPFDGDGP